MTKKERAAEVLRILGELYPDAECSLNFSTPHELLVAVQLSAQCTDARVNIVTEELFKKYTSPEAFANADFNELAELIRPCGFFNSKAKSIIASSGTIVEKHGGNVPDTMEELTALAGVGRKTANLILGDVYGKPAIVVDTHCIRLSNRLGLTTASDPVKIEFDLKKIIPADEQSKFCHRLIAHGRAVCTSRKPKCENCETAHVCKYFKGGKKNEKNG